MSWTLFKVTFRANWVLGVVFVVIVLIYVSTSVSMFDPASAEEMQAMLDLMPEGVIRAMGFVNLGTDLTLYLGNYLYGFIMIIFPMVYAIVVANRLIARHVDAGSMAYLLTTPTTRVRIASTQAIYLALSLFVIVAFSAGVATAIAETTFPGMLDIPSYLGLNLVTYLALLAASSVSYLSSCTFNDTRYSLAAGAGIPVLFFVFRMLSNLGDELEWMGALSLYSFVDVERLLSEPGYLLVAVLVLVPVSFALFAAGVTVFDRRSLPL